MLFTCIHPQPFFLLSCTLVLQQYVLDFCILYLGGLKFTCVLCTKFLLTKKILKKFLKCFSLCRLLCFIPYGILARKSVLFWRYVSGLLFIVYCICCLTFVNFQHSSPNVFITSANCFIICSFCLFLSLLTQFFKNISYKTRQNRKN